MRITRVELAGTPKDDQQLPRAMAQLTRRFERGWVYAEVLLPDGSKKEVGFRPDDNPTAAGQRHEAGRELSTLLEGTDCNAKSYVSIVETIVAMDGPEPHAEEPDDRQIIEQAMQEAFTPEAVAAIAWGVRRTITNNQRVQRQLDWLATILETMVGGLVEHQKTCDELGLER